MSDQQPRTDYSSVRKPAAKADDNVQRVTNGKVSVRKKTLGEKFTETFLASDARSVGDHVIFDVIIPALKDTLSNLVTSTVNLFLFGERRGNPAGRYQDRQAVYTSYNRYYNREERRPVRSRAPYLGGIAYEFTFDFWDDANRVLGGLRDLIDRNHRASVKDLYILAGMHTDYTKDYWGWTDLRDADIWEEEEGFVLKLPRPEPIDRI